MKYSIFLLALFLSPHLSFASCDISKTARQTVKALVAIQDIRGIVAYYGGIKETLSGKTIVSIETHCELRKDLYSVTLRNSDCRVLEAVLLNEGLPL